MLVENKKCSEIFRSPPGYKGFFNEDREILIIVGYRSKSGALYLKERVCHGVETSEECQTLLS